MNELSQRVLQLFLAGATFPQIASAVDVDEKKVTDIVAAAIEDSSSRRALLMQNARAIHQERTEALFKAHWAPALRGDHRSAEICRRILERQAQLLGVAAQVMEGDSVDEIAARRAARRAGTTSGSSRAKRPG